MSAVPVHVEYRNATYYGGFNNYQRNGKGILITDNSQIILAEWRNNELHGSYIYISDSVRAYGTMVDNTLDGYNIITISPDKITDKSRVKETANRTIYATFRADRVYGKCVMLEDNVLIVAQFVNNELQELILKKSIHDREVYDALTEYFPNSMYTLEEFLISFFKQAARDLEESEENPRFQPIITYFPNGLKFYGYHECNRNGKRFGFILSENELVSIGEHMEHSLEGIGRLVRENGIEDGVFSDGRLTGIGIKYSRTGNKYTVGEHDTKGTLEKGFGFPTREIVEIRKEFHLRSIYFYNDILMSGVQSQMEGILEAIFQANRNIPTDSSPRFYGQSRVNNAIKKSPLQAKLHKYQLETDLIEESSPIHNKPVNEYKPIDHRTLTYFTLENNEAEPEPRHVNKHMGTSEKARQSYEDPYSNSRKINEDKKKTYHQMLNHQMLNQKTKKTALMEQDYQDRPRSRSNSRFSQKKGNAKDTREFVKELEEEEKKKRLDLDKIYREAKLYRR